MKTLSMQLLLSAFFLAVTSVSFAQKKNVQNAVMDYNAYEKALMNKNMGGAKKSILSAKENIDLAASNAETANDLKMLFYKGKIYMGLGAVAAMSEDDAELKSLATEATIQTGLDAWKTCYELDTKGKYRDDIKMQVMMATMQSNSMGANMFGEQKFEEAFELFSTSIKLFDIIGKNDKDYGATAFNAGLSAERINKFEEAFNYFNISEKSGFEPAGSAAKAANALYNLGKENEAMNFAVEASKRHPGDGGLIVTMADLALKTGQDELAIESLNQAISKDPSNGVYHWAVGTVYQRLGRETDAVTSFEKAAKLSPEDDRPFYSLGTIYFNKGVDYLEKANQLRLGDPKFDELEKLAIEEFNKAAPFLEKVITIKGDAGNKDLLTNLFTIHRKIGNSAKAMEFKKRADAL